MDNLREKILIADDNEMNRLILTDMLEEKYELIEAGDGAEAIEILRTRADEIRLVLLDVNMPNVDGFGVLEAMNKEYWIDDIQVIMISAESASDYLHRAYDLGAVDYIARPFDQVVVMRKIVNTIMLYAKKDQLEKMVAEQVAEREKNNSMMVSILSHIVEFRNGESGKHVEHINAITEILLEALAEQTDNYKDVEGDREIIRLASSLHDIGKIAIPSEILNKPGRLTPEEIAVMKQHSAIGSEMMKNMTQYKDEPIVKYSYEICRWHHERWDGRGYPDGLVGDAIPISAQVVSVADVYDALTSARCYKPPYPHEEAIRMILNNECGVFNPILIECLLKSQDSLRKIIQ